MKKKKELQAKVVEDQDLNIAPLIDCVFLLLIFFMVTTVFVEFKGLVVDLPLGGESDQQEEQQAAKKDVGIFVTARGEYQVNGENIPAAELAGGIKAAMELTGSKNVVIQGDTNTQNRYIIYAMDMAQGQGATGMAFAIEQATE